MTAALIVATLAVTWVLLNTTLWWLCFRRPFGSPWNWRVLTGPVPYTTWLDR